jgi:hypothetical protein
LKILQTSTGAASFRQNISTFSPLSMFYKTHRINTATPHRHSGDFRTPWKRFMKFWGHILISYKHGGQVKFRRADDTGATACSCKALSEHWYLRKTRNLNTLTASACTMPPFCNFLCYFTSWILRYSCVNKNWSNVMRMILTTNTNLILSEQYWLVFVLKKPCALCEDKTELCLPIHVFIYLLRHFFILLHLSSRNAFNSCSRQSRVPGSRQRGLLNVR